MNKYETPQSKKNETNWSKILNVLVNTSFDSFTSWTMMEKTLTFIGGLVLHTFFSWVNVRRIKSIS